MCTLFDKYSDNELSNMIIEWRDNVNKEGYSLRDKKISVLILIVIELVHDLWELDKEQILNTVKAIHNKFNTLNNNTFNRHYNNNEWEELINFFNKKRGY